jgi:carbonic anhydrase/acetyltransferase-like protein (isoleucine patch superfamily)
MISMGAILLDGVLVGKGSLVAAGCVVAPNTKIPPNSLVMGVPGKVVRLLSEVDQERIANGWTNYLEYALNYKQQLVRDSLPAQS